MTTLISSVVNGLAAAAILFFISSGLSLVFGFMNILNLAHGSLFMLGGFLMVTATVKTGSFLAGLGITVCGMALIGALLHLTLIRRLVRATLYEQILVTFGLIYVISDCAKWAWGPTIRSVEVPELWDGVFKIADAYIPKYRILLIISAFVVVLVLWLVLENSRIGDRVKAGVYNLSVASALGINVDRLFSVLFISSAILAGIGGALGAPIMGAYLGLDLDILISALIVVIVGGLGSVRGALLGSVLLGLGESIGKTFAPELAALVPYIVMLVILVAKPDGLLGNKYATQ